MADSSSLYGSTTPQGTVASSNYTTLYSGGNNFVPSGDNVIISGTLTVNGCAILTDCNSFNLLPLNATTVNAFGSATAVSIGGATGVTTIQNQLSTGNYLFPLADGTAGQVLTTDGSGNLSFTNSGTVGRTYSINATTTTGGANFNLIGSDATTDTIKFANGSNMSIVRTDADTITFNATDTNTTYTIQADSTTGGANLTLIGSDSSSDPVKFAQGSGIQVVRTDANTITITNTDPGSAGVSSITGTANQVIASASTGAVTLSTPQDIATTSSPTFNALTLTNGITLNNDQTGNAIISAYGGTTLGTLTWDGSNWTSSNGFYASQVRGGNITVGYVNDNTISTLTGDLTIDSATNLVAVPANLLVNNGTLYVDATNNRVGINNTSPQYELHIDQGLDGVTQLGMTTGERTMILTMNDIDDLLSLSYGTSPGTNRLQFSPTAQWFNSGSLGVGTATPAHELDVQGTGSFSSNLIATGGFTLNGTTSGSTTFSQSTTGPNINYVLPTAQGAVSTVLTNDGSGNLTWALPGGGGSTFGNVTVGVATDNTISTTTGDLLLTSATNTVSVSNKLGINTTTPSQELTVSDGGDGYVQIGMVNTERTWLVTNNAGDDFISYSVVPAVGPTVNRLQFDATGGNQWFNSGSLGVNTNTPAYTLDVNGDIKVGGDTIYNSYDEKLIDYTQYPTIYGTARQANFQATNNIGVRASFLDIDGRTEFNTTALNTTTTAADQVLAYFDQTQAFGVKTLIKVYSGGEYQCLEVLMVQNGTTISLNTYGDVNTGGNLTSVSSGYNATTGYWELRVTPVNALTSYTSNHQILY